MDKYQRFTKEGSALLRKNDISLARNIFSMEKHSFDLMRLVWRNASLFVSRLFVGIQIFWIVVSN